MSARYETLAKWVNEFRWTLGAELGVSDGRTFVYLLKCCPDLHMLGVDIWDDRGTVKQPTASDEVCECAYCLETRMAKRNMPMKLRKDVAYASARKFGNQASLRKMETVEAAKGVEDHSLDFVFIDADHSTEGVSSDIAAWKSKVKPGGRLIGHDINMASVIEGVACHFAAWSQEDDHVWWVQL